LTILETKERKVLLTVGPKRKCTTPSLGLTLMFRKFFLSIKTWSTLIIALLENTDLLPCSVFFSMWSSKGTSFLLFWKNGYEPSH